MGIQFNNVIFLIEVHRKFIIKFFYWIMIFYFIYLIQMLHQFSFIFYSNLNFNSLINLFFQIINIINFDFLENKILRFIFLFFVLTWLIINYTMFLYFLFQRNITQKKKKYFAPIFLIIEFLIQFVFHIPSNNLFFNLIFNLNDFKVDIIFELTLNILIFILIFFQKPGFFYLLVENFYYNSKSLFLKFNFNFMIFLNIFNYVVPCLKHIYLKYLPIYTLIIMIILIFYNLLIILYFFKYNIYLNRIEKKLIIFTSNLFFILLFFNIFIIVFSIKNKTSIIYIMILLIIFNIYICNNYNSNLYLNNSKNIWKKIIYYYINNKIDSSINFKIFRLHNKTCQNISCECKKIINKDLLNINKVSILKILVNNHLKVLKINPIKKRMLEINLIKNIEQFLYQYISLTIKHKNTTKNSKNSIKIVLLKNLLNKYIKRININDNLNNVSFEELTNFYRNYKKFKNSILEYNVFFNKNIWNYNLEVENVDLLKKNILILNKMNINISKLYYSIINNKNSNVVKLIYLNFIIIFLNDKIKGFKIYNELLKENNKSNINNNVLSCYTINFFVIASIETNFSLTFLEYSESFAKELKYNLEEIKTIGLSNILLYSIYNIHDSYIKNFLKDKKFSKNNKKKVFVSTKDGYVKCYKMEFKIIPEIVNKLKIIGIFKKIKKYKYFVVLDLYKESTFLFNKKLYNDFKLFKKNENYYLRHDESLLAIDYFKDLKKLKNLNDSDNFIIDSIYKDKKNESYELNCTNIKTIVNSNDFKILFIGFNYKIIKMKNNLAVKIKNANRLLTNVFKLNKEKKINNLNNEFGFNNREKMFKKVNNNLNNIIILLLFIFFLALISLFLILRFGIIFNHHKINNQNLFYSFNENSFIYYKYIYDSNLLYEHLINNENYNEIINNFKKWNNDFNKFQKMYVNSINFSNNLDKNKIKTINEKKIKVYVSNNENLSKVEYYSINNFYNILSKSEIIRNSPEIKNHFDNIFYLNFNFLSNYNKILEEIEQVILKSIEDKNYENIFLYTNLGLILLFWSIVFIIFFVFYYILNKYINNKISFYFSEFKKTIKNNNINNKNYEDNEIKFNFVIEEIEYFQKILNNNNNNNNKIENSIYNKSENLETNNKRKLSNIIKQQKYKSNNKIYKNYVFYIILFIIFLFWINFCLIYINYYFHQINNRNFVHFNNIFKIKIIINKFMILYINSFSKFQEIKSQNYLDKFRIEYDIISKSINEIFTINNYNSFLYGNYIKNENDFFNINSCLGFKNEEQNCNSNELYNKGAFSIIIFIYENLRKEIGIYNKNLILETSKIINYLDNRLQQIDEEFLNIQTYFINVEFYLTIILLIIFFIYLTYLFIYLIRILFNLRKNIKKIENYLSNFI